MSLPEMIESTQAVKTIKLLHCLCLSFHECGRLSSGCDTLHAREEVAMVHVTLSYAVDSEGTGQGHLKPLTRF